MRKAGLSPWIMRLAIAAGVALALAVIVTVDVRGYDFYSDTTAPDGLGNCASCHEGGAGGFIGRNSLHGAHDVSATGTCRRCHTSTGDVPRLGSSGIVGGLGCIGCHGQVLPTGGSSGAGLRLHHLMANVPADPAGRRCNAAGCHASDPLPPPENTMPAYYGATDVVQTNPCNTDGLEDFWSLTTGAPDGKGLDNDGDLLYDNLTDTDCGAVACRDNDGDGFGDPGEPACANGPRRDCDDTRASVFPGAAEPYDSLDNDCDIAVDEIHGDSFNTVNNKVRYSWTDQAPAGQLYDVMRSGSKIFAPADVDSACLALATPFLFVDDTLMPALGKALYYLVRNTQVADYDVQSNGTPRMYTICP